MALVLRHLLAVLLLPFVVVVAVPAWLLTDRTGIGTGWEGASLWEWLSRSAGGITLLGGLALFGWCVALFARVGRGTLAPWDPTRELVAVGPYRHVRNPMISGVVLMLVGEALLWRSWALSAWAAVVVLVNHAYFVLSEEPGLEERFGERYRVYKANVPRWVPRLRPWDGMPESPPPQAQGAA